MKKELIEYCENKAKETHQQAKRGDQIYDDEGYMYECVPRDFFTAGFECAMEYIKEKIEERKQQIFPRKKGAMIVGSPKYEDRLYLNALCWVESLIDN